MFRKFAVLALAAAVLCGCVLASRAPIYGDKDAALVLGPKGGIAKGASWLDGKWVEEVEAEADPIKIAVQERHYIATVKGEADVEFYFVRLRDNWHVVQAIQADQSIFSLAEVKNGTAEFRPISCSDLKGNVNIANFVNHEDGDCFVKPGAKAKELFTALLDNPGPPTFRMEIIH